MMILVGHAKKGAATRTKQGKAEMPIARVANAAGWWHCVQSRTAATWRWWTRGGGGGNGERMVGQRLDVRGI